MNIAVLGHSFLGENHYLKGETEQYLTVHPDVADFYVAGISGLRYEGTARLLQQMKESRPQFEPDCIYLLMGDNDVCTRGGRPRMGLHPDAFPAFYHDSREAAVALCEDVVGWGNCCSSLPFPRFHETMPGGKKTYDPRTLQNKIAGNYVGMLFDYRPDCDLPSVPQRHRAPYVKEGKLFPRRPTRTLFQKDGIHPALGAFDQLLRPSLEEWIGRCKRCQ